MSTADGDPLVAARVRGKRLAIAEFNRRENLRRDEAASYSGRTSSSIDAARQRGELYALTLTGHDVRYPRWQFEAPADRLAAALRPFVQAGASGFVIHQFMQRTHVALGGRTAAGVILDVGTDIEAVTRLALRSYADQGPI